MQCLRPLSVVLCSVLCSPVIVPAVIRCKHGQSAARSLLEYCCCCCRRHCQDCLSATSAPSLSTVTIGQVLQVPSFGSREDSTIGRLALITLPLYRIIIVYCITINTKINQFYFQIAYDGQGSFVYHVTLFHVVYFTPFTFFSHCHIFKFLYNYVMTQRAHGADLNRLNSKLAFLFKRISFLSTRLLSAAYSFDKYWVSFTFLTGYLLKLSTIFQLQCKSIRHIFWLCVSIQTSSVTQVQPSLPSRLYALAVT